MVREFNVHLVNLDPTIGSEMRKTRPCVILSATEMNAVLGTVIIAPMTTTLRGYPSRIEIRFDNKFCEVCLDQLRVVDETRLSKQSIGRIKSTEIDWIKSGLSELFHLG
jgi:mRNA interferase MazF